MSFKRVVVTGIGSLTAIGNNTKSYWENLVAGTSGAANIQAFDTTHFKTKFACELKDFDILDHMDRKSARKMDPFTQYAMVVSEEAIADSGILDYVGVDKTKIGVIWGSGVGGIQTLYQETKQFVENDEIPKYNPFFIPKMIADIAPGMISIKYGLMGPNFTTVSACASSTNSIIDAFHYIRMGKAVAIVTGGSEASVCEPCIGGFNALKALSTRNDDPKTASRPFDKERDGFVLGEGAGALILEEYDHAVRRGATIYAEVVGSGLSADAHHMTAPHPEGLGAKLVMENALEDAQLEPEAIDYINVHGTSTPLGDVAEVKAIQHVFGDHAYKLNISSTKSMTGHLLGAAGVVEAIASILALKHGIIPPTINHFTDDEALDTKLNLTFNVAQKREIKYSLSNTFGFGGHNASVIFKKVEQ